MGTRCLQLFLALLTSIKRIAQRNQSAKMMKFTVLMVLLAVAAVQSKKYYGGCVGTLCGGYGGLAYGGVAVAAAPVVSHAVVAAPAVAVGYGLAGGCVNTLSGCGGYVSLGYS